MLGETIRIIRIANDLTVKELAEKAEISASYMSEIENGTKVPSLETLGKISAAFHIPVSQIFKFDEEKNENNYSYIQMLIIILSYYVDRANKNEVQKTK